MIISTDGKELTIGMPDNWHAHFRQGKLLEFVTRVLIESGWRGRVAAEPNTEPPILTGEQAVIYNLEILAAAKKVPNAGLFEPVMIIQITESTTPEMIRNAYKAGVGVCKVYPRYVTTNSENGVVDYLKIYPALAAAEELGMVVQFHPEHPSYQIIGRLKEEKFIGTLVKIREAFPALKISVEHVSSRAMVEWVKRQQESVGASITVHHLYQTADDLAGYSERSGGKVCVDDGAFKPGAKDPDDRLAIQEAALSGDRRFWYGGDDAPHLKSKKHCSRCACGTWNTIPALPMLIMLFEENKSLEKLEGFLCDHGADFYDYPKNEESLTFRREAWQIPAECEVPGLGDSIVPFYAGATAQWKLVA